MRRTRRTGTIVGLAASCLLLSGCSSMAEDTRSQDLCTQFQQLTKNAADFGRLDAAQAGADELRAKAETFRDELNQVQAVAEGRLDTAITNLEAALDDVRQAANDAGQKAQDEARALYKDDLKAVAEQWAIVREAVLAQCSQEDQQSSGS